jgi:hypothetical protein
VKGIPFLLALALTIPVAAQEKAKKPAPKPSPGAKSARHVPPAHSKPTPQQIRKFNELEKKESKQAR